jgi:hypothetical protein
MLQSFALYYSVDELSRWQRMNRFAAVIALLCVSTALLKAQPNDATSGASFIEVEYCGKQDRPVFPLIISDSDQGADLGRKEALRSWDPTLAWGFHVYVVRTELMLQLISELEGIHGKRSSKNGTWPSFNLVSMQHGEKRRFAFGAEEAVVLLKRMERFCTKKELIADLDRLKGIAESQSHRSQP